MTMPPSAFRLFLAFLTLGSAFCLVACNFSDGSSVREWTPTDHTNQSNPSAGQIDTKQKRAGMDKLEAQGINDVVFAAWKANCVACHGTTGRGDGPQGRMVRPPDMTSPAWQRTRIDTEMAQAIKKGRGKMPAFGHLPDKTIDGLVKLVRMLNPDLPRETEGAADPTQGAAPRQATAPSHGAAPPQGTAPSHGTLQPQPAAAPAPASTSVLPIPSGERP